MPIHKMNKLNLLSSESKKLFNEKESQSSTILILLTLKLILSQYQYHVPGR